MKHIKIILVSDQRYPGPAGCAACYYKDRGEPGCQQPFPWGQCLKAGHGGVFTNGGHHVVKASVSRNKREGKFVGGQSVRFGNARQVRIGTYLPPELGGQHG